MENKALIEFSNATICHHDHLVLSQVNLKIQKGEYIYLIGKVGSGKSSLIKTINAEIPLQKGEAWVAGFSLHKLKKRHIHYLRRKIGVVFQDFQLMTDRNVHENLSFVLKATGWKNKKEIENKISEVLNLVAMSTKGYKMPHQLSGGEQQRIVIARALLNDPEIILADEPTGNLDPETSSDIVDLLHQICQTGRTVIMATHNYNFLKKYQARVIRCHEGSLIETNLNEEIDFDLLKM